MKTSFRLIYVLFFLVIGLANLEAQTWKKSYGSNGNERGILSTQKSNGDFQILCTGDTTYFMHVDHDGNFLWNDTISVYSTNNVKILNNGDYLASGISTDGQYPTPYVTRFDANGTTLWTQFYRDTIIDEIAGLPTIFYAGTGQYSRFDFTELQDGSIMFNMGYFATFSGPSPQRIVLSKIDENGELIWENIGNWAYWDYFEFATLTNDNVAIYSGNDIWTNLDVYDSDGNYLWSADLDEDGSSLRIIGTADGGVLACELNGSSSEYNDQGILINETDPIGPSVNIRKILALPDGSFTYVCYRSFGTDPTDYMIRRIYSTTANNWENRQYYKPLDQIPSDIIRTSDGGFLMAGYTATNLTEQDIYLIKTDSFGLVGDIPLVGNIANDVNFNCQIDSLEEGLGGFVVIASNGESNYGITNGQGDYIVRIDTGEYTVQVIAPNAYWEVCTPVTSITIDTLDEEYVLDFEAQPLIDCPYMTVDISTPLLRRCMNNTFFVNYCNEGTISTDSVRIEVVLDERLQVDSTSIPLSLNIDNLYIFNIGTVDIQECNSFNIYTTLDPECDETTLGETVCTEAHIFPDSVCLIDPNWTGANIELSSDCQPDSLSFFIENTGSGNMAAPLDFVIIEDEVILRQGTYFLNSGDMQTEKVVSNGSTYRIAAQQEPFHPEYKDINLTVEGCGVDSLGEVSYGYTNVFPDNDFVPYLSVECLEIIGSWDPNDKAGFPYGYGEEHYIDQNEPLEYKIRFQNTGTDTAFNVRIIDTLSMFLNPVTIRPGASSHAYTYSLSGEGILTFDFQNIMLPDSNVNELLSHGFVKFEIEQQVDNPIGSVINNSAAIYFDFNEPVITNTTFHEIGEDYITIIVDPETGKNGVKVLISPNPFSDQTTIEIIGSPKDLQKNLILHNSIGQAIRTEAFEGNQLQFHKRELIAGIYFYQVVSADGAQITGGKIMVNN